MLRVRDNSYYRQTGFSLIEVLISIFVLSVGLLGAASIQLQGMQNAQSAYLRSQATIIAYDMADRMRANPVGLANGDYDVPTATADADCLTTVGCTPVELADHDYFEWNGNGVTSNSISNILPLGGGIVCIDSSPDDGNSADAACDGLGTVYAIKVWWSDDRSQANANARIQRFVTTVSF